jgi:hypothetical protein
LNASIDQTENLLFITLLQLIVMVGAARYMQTAFRRIGQPGVMAGPLLKRLLSNTGHSIPVGLEA